MKEFWSAKAKNLTPYTPGEQTCTDSLKLNTNENPYPPSPAVARAIADFDVSRLALYPRTDGGEFKTAAARINGVDEKNIFCSNGSDEALAVAFYAFFDHDVRTPEIGYSFYPVWADLFGIELVKVPMKADFTVDVCRFAGKGCVIANPNAPTGIALNLHELKRILENTSGVVIIDEAYIDFGAETALPLLASHKNLVIVRTLSKGYSLAGMRVGYVIAHSDLISALDCVKDSFNSYPTDMLAQKVGACALLDSSYNALTCNRVIKTREFTASALTKLGFTVLPSAANFVFCSHKNLPAHELYLKLRDRDIIVRHFSAPGISNFLRITIGTDEGMQQILEAIATIIGQ